MSLVVSFAKNRIGPTQPTASETNELVSEASKYSVPSISAQSHMNNHLTEGIVQAQVSEQIYIIASM